MGQLRRFAAVATLIGLLAAVPPLAARARVEAAARTVALAAEATSFRALADASGTPYAALLGQLRAAGVTAALVPEATLADLDLPVWAGSEVLDLRAAGRDPLPGVAVRAGATYVLGAPSDVAANLADRLGPDRVHVLPGGVLALDDPAADARQRPLGFPAAYLAPYAAAGTQVILSVRDATHLPPGALPRWLAAARSRVAVIGLYFADGRAPALAGLPVPLVVQEGPAQLGNVDNGGVRALDRALGGDTLRLFDMAPYAPHRAAGDVELTVERAVRDRNIRVVALYPVTKGVAGAEVPGATLAAYADLGRLLREDGFTLGAPRPLPPLPQARPWLAVMGAAVAVAAAALVVTWRGRGRAALPAAGAAGAVLALAAPEAARPALALVAALAYGAWAMWLLAGTWRRRDVPLLGPAAVAAAVATAGGLLVAALLSTRDYLLEWSVFHGVKLAYLVPPAVAAAGWYAFVAGRRPLWRERLRAVELLAVACVLAAGYLYLARSGNSTLVSGLELAFRNALQRDLPVRPRTKEILVGYPCLVFAVVALRRRLPGWFLVFALGGSAAVASVINSFATVNTPWLTSLLRGVLGFVLGTALGAVLAPLVDRLLLRWQRWLAPQGTPPAL